MRLRVIKTEVQKTDMEELVAAAGMWKYRCDSLKRDVMEQVKGMGDKMDWVSYYPEGKSPLDHVEISNYSATAPETPGRSVWWQPDIPTISTMPKPKVERSTIDRLLVSFNSGKDGQEVLTTTARPLEPAPMNRFQGRELVNELIRDMSGGGPRNTQLSYDRQQGMWTLPDFFTENYTRHAEEFKSPEVCTILDVFAAAPELGTLEELGGCDLLYLPKLNQDDPYYNPLFMTTQQRNAYRESGSLDIIRQAYMAHDNS